VERWHMKEGRGENGKMNRSGGSKRYQSVRKYTDPNSGEMARSAQKMRGYSKVIRLEFERNPT
jgi:hypothetical protein